MISKEEKIPGIIGGMGPEATVDLMQQIIIKTPALDDDDHIRCIIDNNPKVPSRIAAILGNAKENPGEHMAHMARRLERWGADFLVIACNTAHNYYVQVAAAVTIPVVHLIDLVVHQAVSQHHNLQTVGILGSHTIIKTGLYAAEFATKGVSVTYPDDQVQEDLFQIIRRVKAGETGSQIQQEFRVIGSQLAKKGTDMAILACTELGVIARDLPFPYLDATEVLAQEIVDIVKGGKIPHSKSINTT